MIHVMRVEGRQRKPRFSWGRGGNEHDMMHHVGALEMGLPDGTAIHWDGITATATVDNVRYHTIVK